MCGLVLQILKPRCVRVQVMVRATLPIIATDEQYKYRQLVIGQCLSSVGLQIEICPKLRSLRFSSMDISYATRWSFRISTRH